MKEFFVFLGLFIPCAFVIGCADIPSSSISKPCVSAAMNGAQYDEYCEIVVSYVEKEKRWHQDAYEVEFSGSFDTVRVYSVLHEDFEKLLERGIQGDGKSFEAHVDVRQRRVVQVLYFQ